MSGIASDRRALAIDERTIVLDQTFKRFPAQVEAVECRIAALEIRHDAQGLRVIGRSRRWLKDIRRGHARPHDQMAG